MELLQDLGTTTQVDTCENHERRKGYHDESGEAACLQEAACNLEQQQRKLCKVLTVTSAFTRRFGYGQTRQLLVDRRQLRVSHLVRRSNLNIGHDRFMLCPDRGWDFIQSCPET